MNLPAPIRRAGRHAHWFIPPLICLALYWYGLLSWFQQDDFAWLSLRFEVTDWPSFWTTLFEPKAQGTIRPLSERVYFLGLQALFGLDPLPFRIVAFATQLGSLVLLTSIVLRLTASRLAAVLASVFWIVNSSLHVAMSWTSAYNQILCGFFLLLAFNFLLRHVETGRWRYYVYQWLAFLAGFGALEVNVVYPALAISYTVLCARRYVWRTLPLLVPSIVYVLVHNWVSPKPKTGLYAMYLDWGLLESLRTYWLWAFGDRLEMITPDDMWNRIDVTVAWVISAGLLAFVLWQAWRRQWLPAFFTIWFLIALSPVLPLKLHVTEYYLTTPVIGLAAAGAVAFHWAWKKGSAVRILAVLLACAYLALNGSAAWFSTKWRYNRGEKVRLLMGGIARVREMHPNKIILLHGVSSDEFWAAIVDKPFHLIGVSNWYLTPGSEATIIQHPELGDVAEFTLPQGPTRRALDDGKAVVYAAGGGRLKNITTMYHALARQWTVSLPLRVDVGKKEFAGLLGPEWHAIEGAGHRWSPKRATVRLCGPERPGQRLVITGYVTEEQMKKGPLRMTVSIEGAASPPVTIRESKDRFEFSFPLERNLLGKESIQVAVEFDRTFRVAGDGREFGAVFGVFAIR